MLNELSVQVALIEIADNDDLIHQYGIRIPVLKRQDNGRELNWPFTTQDILLFLK